MDKKYLKLELKKLDEKKKLLIDQFMYERIKIKVGEAVEVLSNYNPDFIRKGVIDRYYFSLWSFEVIAVIKLYNKSGSLSKIKEYCVRIDDPSYIINKINK